MLTSNEKTAVGIALAALFAGGVGYAAAGGGTQAPVPLGPRQIVVDVNPVRGTIVGTVSGTTTTAYSYNVMDLQAALKRAGTTYARLLGTTGPHRDGVDGSPGAHTDAAVKAWETAHALPATGLADPDTLYRVLVALHVPTSVVPTTAPAYDVRRFVVP